jgi:ABC-type sugar transport system substrate-binding protein
MDGKIGVFVNTGDDYHRHLIREAEEAAQREGLAIEVFDVQHTAAKQAQDLIRFERDNSGKKLCICLVPEADAMHGGGVEKDPTLHLAQRLLQKGVGWIALNHGREEVITSLRSQFPKLPIALVAVDNLDFGRIQARQLRTLLPRGGTALLVCGHPFETACQERSAGMKQELQGSGITLEEVEALWEASVAEKAVHKWITSPIRRRMALDALVCQNDQMGVGARRALMGAAGELDRPELKRIPVIGGDGLPDLGRRWVDDGTLTATVCVTLPGRPAVEQLARHWRDGAPLQAVTRLAVTSYPGLSALSPAGH